MIKLKDLLFENVAHTQKSLQWVYHDYIPMTPKVMKQIMGDVPITTFHNLNPEAVKKQLPKVIGKKKSISTFTADTEGNLAKGSGVQTSGGVVLEVEGKVLVAGTEDLGSVPDESGRRWIHPNVFGKIVGMKQFEGGGGGIYYRKGLYKYDKKLEDILWRYKTSLLIAPTDSKEDTDRFKYKHLAGSLSFLPYGACVDHFQHWVYENPEATPQERKDQWLNLEGIYLPGRDYDDIEFPKTGGIWQGQLHIYQVPFYYIDYTLAQTCAFQFWIKSELDIKKAWKDYYRLCQAGGSKSFTGLVELAGLISPFNEGCLENVVDKAKKWLNNIDVSSL